MYLDQLLACMDVLLRQCGSDCGSVSLQLLQVLVTVQSLSTEPQLSNKVRKQKHKDAPVEFFNVYLKLFSLQFLFLHSFFIRKVSRFL